MMTFNDREKLREIRKLLKEAYDHYFVRDADGHCKSDEGQISVHFSNYWQDGNDQMKNIIAEKEEDSIVAKL